MNGIIEAFRTAPTWLWLSVISGVSFVLSVIGIPIYLARAPSSLLVGDPVPWRQLGPKRVVLRVLKNALAVLLLIAGLVMLVGPGQGILTLIVALGLLDAPGKRRLQRKLLFRPGVLRLVNRLRDRAGSELIEDDAAKDGSERLEDDAARAKGGAGGGGGGEPKS